MKIGQTCLFSRNNYLDFFYKIYIIRGSLNQYKRTDKYKITIPFVNKLLRQRHELTNVSIPAVSSLQNDN